jgi:hypothetical protein
VLVPILSPLVFVALAVLLATRRRTYAAVLLVLAACALWPTSVAFVYEGFPGLAVTPAAAFLLAPFLVASLAVTPVAFRLFRRAAASRALLAGVDRALMWSLCAAAVNVAVACFFAFHGAAPQDLNLVGCALAGTVVMTSIAAGMTRTVKRAARDFAALPLAPSNAEVVPVDTPLPAHASRVDWGVGDARRVLVDGPYRAVARTVWVGDRDTAARRLRWAKPIALVAVLVAALGAAIAFEVSAREACRVERAESR